MPIRLDAVLCPLAAVALAAGTATAQSNPVILQWFETEWEDIERRTPDFFLAGYNAVWLPPPSKASFTSAGYDPFDRFDLGGPPITALGAGRARTTFGTEESFGAMVESLHRANSLVYVDGIFNHNSGRTTSDFFLELGGYPGFHIPRENPPRNKLPTDDWGDFHGGNASGFLQSENPGAPNYSLTDGDLVALIDINPASVNNFIRHPVGPNPANIPAGTVHNNPDPNNAALYTDTDLPSTNITNPGTARTPGVNNFVRHPFNQAAPLEGDPVVENATGLLMRWAQWMMEVQNIDGFRLDALKHQTVWFWDTFFDAAVFETRTDPNGNKVTPFTFGENTTDNITMINDYIRKDSFADRDSLDLNGAARLREIVNAGGFGTWGALFANTGGGNLDIADDGVSNGSVGVNHVFSHDNGTVGDGGSLPPLPTARQMGYPQHAYTLMRPGRSIVYHHGRGIPRSGGFFPREGASTALGLDPAANALDDTMTNLVRLHNEIAWGQYFQLNSNISDVLVFARGGPSFTNCIVGVNDRYDNGVNTVTVTTNYPPGARLHEQTGNAADPVVDPTNIIPETITVGPGGSITLQVPRNTSATGVEHGKGFVVYSEALPSGTLGIGNASGEIPADPTTFPSFFRRLNAVPVVTADNFRITLNTTQTDPLDNATDDNALFKIDAGTQDFNGNGVVDFAPSAVFIGGYEEFVTINQPTFGSGGSTGTYSQEIDATTLDEGYHYISVIAFRNRPAFTTPIFREFREVVYVDRLDPVLEFTGLEDLDPEATSVELAIRNPDRTVEAVHVMLDLPEGADPVAEADIFNAASRWDRLEWRRSVSSLSQGEHVLTVVAFEPSGRAVVTELPFTIGSGCTPDLAPPTGVLDFNDVLAFLGAFSSGDPAADLAPPFGTFDFNDVIAYLGAFSAGCP